MASDDTPPSPPEPHPQSSAAAWLGWIAIGLGAVSFGFLFGLEEWSTTRAAWDVILGGACAIAALVLAILAFRRRSQLRSRALPIGALVVAIIVCVFTVGAASNRSERASEARACADRDNAWIARVNPALVTYRREVVRLDRIKIGRFADQEIRARAPAMQSLIALGEAAAETDPCDPRVIPFNDALIRAGQRANEVKLAGEAVLAEPTSQRLVDRWSAAMDRAAAAETEVNEEGVTALEAVQRRGAG